MNTSLKYCFILLLVSFSQGLVSQSQSFNTELFTLRGSVREKYSYEPIRDARIEVNGGYYATTSYDGEFRIKVRVGDQLVVRHRDFETVFYDIISEDKVIIEAEYTPTPSQIRKRKTKLFIEKIDSAMIYMKSDAEKSLQFVVGALENTNSVKENSQAYETLGDIYSHWKQYDLAIVNYKISLQNMKSNEVLLKLGEVYRLNKNSEESINILKAIIASDLTNWQLVNFYEDLGDSYLQIKDYELSIESYNKGLKVAQEHLITPKITDLNSKIAQAYTSSGSVSKAKEYFNNSLRLASKENKKRALEEKITVADFQNTNRDYDQEIESAFWPCVLLRLNMRVSKYFDVLTEFSLPQNHSLATRLNPSACKYSRAPC